MKKKRGKVITALWILMCLGIMLLSGCKEKNVDYSIEDTEGTKENVSSEEASSLAQFADAREWKEDWEGTAEDGSPVHFHVEAEIKVPDADSMSVVEVTVPKVDSSYKERIVQTVFGETDVYYYDDVYLPKTVLQERIKAYENTIDYCREDEIDTQDIEEKLIVCEEALKTAGEDYMLATDYEANMYLGYRNGAAYILSVEQHMDSYTEGLELCDISLVPENVEDMRPTEPITLTEEEARKIAEGFLGDIGITGMIYKGTEPLTWEDDLAQESPGEVPEKEPEGYMLQFELGTGEVSFLDFGTENDYLYWFGEPEVAWYSMGACAWVNVTEDGVVQLRIYNPIEVTAVTKDVKLLPLENIQNIIQDELKNHTDEFQCNEKNGSYSFNSLELIYFRVPDDAKEGYYSYVPVWRLCDAYGEEDEHRTYANAIFINAIDGSAIHALTLLNAEQVLAR